jgi:hypothetical protein
MNETPLTGSDADRATAAAQAAVPGGTVLHVETDADGGGSYEAHVRTSDGTEVVVTMDDSESSARWTPCSSAPWPWARS